MLFLLSRNEAFMHFLLNFIKRLQWNGNSDFYKKLYFVFPVYVCKLYDCAKFHYDQITEEKTILTKSKFSNFYFLATLKWKTETFILSISNKWHPAAPTK